MVRRIENLKDNAARFAQHCVKQGSISAMVASAQNGIDYNACERWGLTGEEWQDAIFAALEEFRDRR